MNNVEQVSYMALCPNNCGRVIEWIETYHWTPGAYGGEYDFNVERTIAAAPTYVLPCECQTREETG